MSDPKPLSVEELTAQLHALCQQAWDYEPDYQGTPLWQAVEKIAARVRELDRANLTFAEMEHAFEGWTDAEKSLMDGLHELHAEYDDEGVLHLRQAAAKVIFDMKRERDEARGERDRIKEAYEREERAYHDARPDAIKDHLMAENARLLEEIMSLTREVSR